ncbi:MAG: VWA domain-containing protein [Pseudomonadaceae bacterium]|nr:VWA domain-containing protein [Pseudomonadaceae bacterium]
MPRAISVSPLIALNAIVKLRARLSWLTIAFLYSVTANADAPTVTAPQQAGINEAIEIKVTGTPKSGDLVRFADTSGPLRNSPYTYVANIKNGRTTLSAPAEPGRYLVAYISEGEIITSSELTVISISAEVTAPDSAGIGATIAVSFNGPRNSGDYLQFLTADGEPIRGLYSYAGTKGAAETNLKAPIAPGRYQIGYFTAKKLIGATPITITPVSATVTVQPRTTANAAVTVSFDGPLNSGDYLQFVSASGQPIRGLYAYAGNAKDGQVKLTAPIEPGDYQIGYFTNKILLAAAPITVTDVSAELIAPEIVTAGAHFDIDWSGPNNYGDRIAIADAKGAINGDYTYPGNHTGPVTLRAPESPGQHSIVYLTGQQIIGQTTFEVRDASASLSARDSVPGTEHFTVEWQGPGNRGDRIEMYANAAEKPATYGYIHDDELANISLQAPAAPGDYLLAYITHGGRQLAQRPITVTPAKQEPGFLQVTSASHTELTDNDAIELVLDASGSMLQRVAGERRIAIAKRTLATLITDSLSPGTPLALRVFGHKEADECRSDLELPLAPLNPSDALNRVQAINAMNLARTPIADSLAATESDLAGVSGERIIVVVTDGEETCDGDPAAVIASLRAKNPDLRVNIVGFAIDDEDLHETFSQWAELGGGRYFRTAQEQELTTALRSSVSPAFTVHLPDDTLVESGIAGAPSISLAPGIYQVRSTGLEIGVSINENKLSTVELSAPLQ